MGDVNTSQAQLIATTEATPDIRSSQVALLATAIYPAEDIESSQLGLMASTMAGMELEVSQALLFVLGRGRISDPNIRVWTFTQDGHDYYVIRLGNVETLVYDLSTEEWYSWGSNHGSLWKAYTGINWLGGTKLGANASNVVVGDDSAGVLYWLDPDYDKDDHTLTTTDNPADPVPFERQITGQVVSPRGYSSTPCFRVELEGAIGQTEEASVELQYSDDRGLTYVSAGSVTVPEGEYHTRVTWQSLGSFLAPGRLFRIIDDGALKRVDSLEMSGENGS